MANLTLDEYCIISSGLQREKQVCLEILAEARLHTPATIEHFHDRLKLVMAANDTITRLYRESNPTEPPPC